MWLVKLLSRKPLGKMKLGPEDQISIEFGDRCRAWSLEGRLRGTWTKVPHEVGGVSVKGSQIKVAMVRYAKQTAMGMITGSGDYVFIWEDGGGWLEFKRPGGSLTDQQKNFRLWCERENVRWAKVTSADDGEAVLRAWGALDHGRNSQS